MRGMFVLTRVALGAAAFAVVPLTAGCGGSSATANIVSGKVTYQGKPLTSGTIEFHGPNNKVGASPIGADGTYSIADPPVGDDTVVVKVPPPPATPPGVDMGTASVVPVRIPDKYGDDTTSGVKQTVSAGRSTVNIDLK